ncbi:hypothetical protein LCM23_06185 [Cytobacillus kochii]|uniref:hypothetical protein n=1 Tax=Cytobacillus kochii TaxID=859143 RepID=UPI001CD21F02|nr:hypothetical protein [Cytobacillus kochii]MCA1025673.1 hypothetical protein [Cytobacillus kochii]
MSCKYSVVIKNGSSDDYETLFNYTSRLSKKNNSILYLLENYLDKKLLSEPELSEIRDIILTVSADLTRINANIKVVCGENCERL